MYSRSALLAFIYIRYFTPYRRNKTGKSKKKKIDSKPLPVFNYTTRPRTRTGTAHINKCTRGGTRRRTRRLVRECYNRPVLSGRYMRYNYGRPPVVEEKKKKKTRVRTAERRREYRGGSTALRRAAMRTKRRASDVRPSAVISKFDGVESSRPRVKYARRNRIRASREWLDDVSRTQRRTGRVEVTLNRYEWNPFRKSRR